VAGSTFTPTPIVLDTETFFRKIPFVAAGFALFNASSSAARLSRSCSGVNEARPIVQSKSAIDYMWSNQIVAVWTAAGADLSDQRGPHLLRD
jgi:hypothetical protein